MSRIARQLCDEIEAPLRGRESQRYRTAGRNDDKPKRTIVIENIPKRSIVIENNPKRNIVIEKQKVNSKVIPNNRSASRIKFKSEESVLNKSFIDIAVNTTHRGPLLSDNNCVTLVRSRTNEKCSCRGPQKCYSFKKHAKQVQTLDHKMYSFSDKACLNCVDTVSCGTQFLIIPLIPKELNTTNQSLTCKTSSHLGKLPRDMPLKKKSENKCVTQVNMSRDYGPQINISQRDYGPQINKSQRNYGPQINNLQKDYGPYTNKSQTNYLTQIDELKDYVTQIGVEERNGLRRANMTQAVEREPELRKIGFKQTTEQYLAKSPQNEPERSTHRIPSVNYMGARRWSLSQCPHRGPDF